MSQSRDSLPVAHAAVFFRSMAVAGLLVLTSAVTAARAEDARTAGHLGASSWRAVLTWNRVATDALSPSQGTDPMTQSRTLAIVQAAVHDAINAVDRRFRSYTPGIADAPGASLDAAVATAAHDALAALLPEPSALVEAAYANALAAVPEGPARAAGIVVGQSAAAANLARRADDGAAQAGEPRYVPRAGVGEYQFTPPFDFAAAPGWGKVTPFVIDLADHVLDGPQRVTSGAYAQDFALVKAIGEKDSRVRTPEQSEIAVFWYEDSPLGWNRIARTIVEQRGLDEWEAARVLALVNFAMADGFIAGFEAKYRFRFWRPETAIRAAASDGNRLTAADPAWQPFQVTPPVPDYPSTHTVLGWAAAEVLIELLGDRHTFRADSLTLPGVVREYRSLSDAAQENGLSRLYAGIHFRQAIRDGRQQGRSIGRAVADALAPMR
ncbi:haloperoxidase [Luteitalea sp. TBR-22]|uniref:vanadium-dependent haloperoxidase n=1 Tax=Luteitalea sp. TBR-22 TaxID=2802971 RepID=UPI001AFB44E7|nr:vanadium-dependent haloperoxidase [Luteitalea sp. TBR-22]BCS31709.1 haloperoxidase [Luteitalea sp. TBR-22]